MNERLARATLMRVATSPDSLSSVGGLLTRGCPAETLVEAIRKRAPWIGDVLLKETTAAGVETAVGQARQDLSTMVKHGTHLIIPGDKDWPGEQFSSAWNFLLLSGNGGGERRPVPLGLWVMGQARLDNLCGRAVTVTGTRRCSAYGSSRAGEIADTLAAAGWTIVTGGAQGIDHAALAAAAARRAVAVAVVGSGVDIVNPPRVKPLLHKTVARGGLVVSEQPPGSPPTAWRLVWRNRITAALSVGTVLVEAPGRSGAGATADWAAAMGRVVMAVPGVVGPLTRGCHERIALGLAQLVTDGVDVRCLIEPVNQHTQCDTALCEPSPQESFGKSSVLVDMDGPGRRENQSSSVQQARLSAVELRVMDAIGTGASFVPELSMKTGLTPAVIVASLMKLHKHWLVDCVDGGWTRARRNRVV